MGDRAVIQLTDGDEYSPVLYLHWAGSNVPTLLDLFHEKFLKVRPDDISYAFARLVGHALRNDIDSDTGFGVWNQPSPITQEQGDEDAGAFLVNFKTLKVKYGGGYKATVPPGSPWKYSKTLR